MSKIHDWLRDSVTFGAIVLLVVSIFFAVVKLGTGDPWMTQEEMQFAAKCYILSIGTWMLFGGLCGLYSHLLKIKRGKG